MTRGRNPVVLFSCTNPNCEERGYWNLFPQKRITDCHAYCISCWRYCHRDYHPDKRNLVGSSRNRGLNGQPNNAPYWTHSNMTRIRATDTRSKEELLAELEAELR